MKKNKLKIIIFGIVIGLIGFSTVFASNKIRSVEYRSTKVTVDGAFVSLDNPLAAIVNEGAQDAKLYMPLRELLEKLGYQVDWDEETDTVCIKSGVKIEGETIIKYEKWPVGYQYNYIALEEDPESDAKWHCVDIDSDVFSLIEEYIEKSNAADKNPVHCFKFEIDRATPETENSEVTITFEKMLNDKKTGSKIIYKIDFKSTASAKPVIYLYPEKKTDITISLDYNGILDYSYPAYNDGWSVTAYPDGKIINRADNKEYSYLFWEGRSNTDYDFSKGFVVKGVDTVEFLQEKLSYMGLTPKEYNEFIVYWMPMMQNNPYNLITFQQEAYTESAKLNISPSPDSLLRVFMAFKPIEKSVDITPQTLNTFERTGFTVVEWGGALVK